MITAQPDTLDRHAAEVAATLLKEHKTDGTHKDVTADSVTMNGPMIWTSASPDTLASTVVNYTPASAGESILWTAMVFRIKASGAISIRGITPSANRLLALMNIGSNNITLENDDTAAIADYRFKLPNATDIVLGADDGALLWYDDISKRWRCFQQ